MDIYLGLAPDEDIHRNLQSISMSISMSTSMSMSMSVPPKSNSLSSSAARSKSGKAGPVPPLAPYCSSSKQTCGQTVEENDKITLTEDLFCAEDWNSATTPVKRSKNCPSLWTLEGDAELDCNGYRISQNTTLGSDSAVTCDDKGKTSLQQKTACQLYYYRGVCLTGSAKIKNCQVETFLEGIYVENISDIKDSTAVSQNRVGIAVNDGPGIVPRYQPREFVSQCFLLFYTLEI